MPAYYEASTESMRKGNSDCNLAQFTQPSQAAAAALRRQHIATGEAATAIAHTSPSPRSACARKLGKP